ncbi:biotin synthase BioB [Desulfarculus baarsii]
MSQTPFPDPLALAGRPPTPAEAAAWLEPDDLGQLGRLLAAAGAARQRWQADAVELCAIVNARSGRCSEDCAFCAQSAHHHTDAQVYPLLSATEIAQRAERAADCGALRFGLVTSGKGCPSGRDLDEICRALELIVKRGRILPCASLGLLNAAQARRLVEAGLRRYHHNLESGPSYFPSICASHAFEERVETVRVAQQAGLEVCCGGIVGMGETPAQRAELAFAVAELAPQSVPVNFLSPIAGTRLAHLRPMGAIQALAALAVFKLIMPQAQIRACGGRAQILGDLAPLMFLAGASAAMTGNYLTTQGPQSQRDLAVIAALGLRPVLPPREE